jgi:hypothetical protein
LARQHLQPWGRGRRLGVGRGRSAPAQCVCHSTAPAGGAQVEGAMIVQCTPHCGSTIMLLLRLLVLASASFLPLCASSSSSTASGRVKQQAVKLGADQVGLTVAEIERLRALREVVLAGANAERFVKAREFGVGGTGHEAVFLNTIFDGEMPGMLERLLSLASAASTEGGWGVIDGSRVTPRCLELIRYSGGDGSSASSAGDSIGWHNDGATLVTMAIMLSENGDYDGGESEVEQERYRLQIGEAAAWRGWTNHRVAPVTRGMREVFVVEWWTEADCTLPGADPRADDSLSGVRHALQIDSENGPLHRSYGEQLCKQMHECATEMVAEEAERAFRRAVELQPTHVLALFDLGFFLLTSDNFLVQREGKELCREAHHLDPNIVSELPPEVEALGQIPAEMMAKLYKMGLVSVLLLGAGPIIWHFEKKKPS